MERGAARASGGGARIIGMDELKQARERRASSASRAVNGAVEYDGGFREQYEEWREERDDRPFWERDDPFITDGYTPSKKAAAGEARKPESARRGKYEQDDEERPMKNNERTQPSRDAARGRRQDIPAGRGGGRRKPAESAKSKKADEDRWSTASMARQYDRTASANKSRTGLYMLILLLGLLALAVAIGLKVFEIASIDVKGNDTISAESVIALSGISKGENIFKVNIGQVKKNIESDPLIEVLGIARIFPDRIKIDIRQRKPHGAIAYLGSYVIIDEKGFVLDERPELPVGQFPLVTGIDIEPAEKGKPVVGINAAVLQVMQDLLTALYDNGAIALISEVNLSQADDIRLLTAEGLQISMGRPSDLAVKAQWIACSVPELRTKGYTSGVLYVTGTGSPVYSAAGSGGQTQPNGDGQTQEPSGGQPQESDDESSQDGQEDASGEPDGADAADGAISGNAA